MKVDIDVIHINERKRKLNVDKVAELAESFLLLGQLEPITIASSGKNYILLAGMHRLEAAKLLSWQTIEAALYQGDDLECELVEIDENLMNNDLTVLEQGEHIQRRNEILEVMGRRAPSYRPEKGVTVTPLKTTDDIAKNAGLSERSAQRRVQIARDIVPEVKELIRDTPIADSTTQLLELARLKHEEQVAVAKQSIEGKMTIPEAKREIKKKANYESKKTLKPFTGKYQVIYADPPWSYNNSGFTQSAASQYPTMAIDKICELRVSDISDNDAVLFLWATSPLLPDALKVIIAWGFEYKASIIWVKDKAPGIGWWVNTKHEILLIASKSNNHPLEKFDSVVEESVTRHSKKPNVFYDMIEKMYTGAKIELFAREKRDGWEVWGNEPDIDS